ncbi:MAG: hypothetical protein COB67_11010 [SAR324 cluster bacterium]|uniref:4Fe-4S ferredoxin-type domain-containing protein n=1 Tax=SAR324 cluster bacterium TaxID=2024889 RepID=A0A2A4SV12_9DELT|nr:MAG: hypothetical protein COB67_11010 [SAR324 cluster bacterium]
MAEQPKKNFKVNRRRFVKTSTLFIVGAAAALGTGAVPILRSNEKRLRPPGALEENHFLASCIKCGQCLQVCPPKVIKLDGLMGGFSVGTPYITPREGGCILCSGLPCVLACPTGSLDHGISLGKEAEMGLAVLSKPRQCLSILGVNDLVFRLEKIQSSGNLVPDENLTDILQRLVEKLDDKETATWKEKFGLQEVTVKEVPRVLAKMNRENFDWLLSFTKDSEQAKVGCRICLEDCPIKDENPISFHKIKNEDLGKDVFVPTVEKTCVGCGVCEERCPTEEASITIVPRMKWKGNA